MNTFTRLMILGGAICLSGLPVFATADDGATAPLRQRHPAPYHNRAANHALPTQSVPGIFKPQSANGSRKAMQKTVEAFTLPFSDNFADGDATRERYTVIDVDNDGYGDGNSVKNCWFWKEDESLIQFCTDNTAPGNDWLISPPLHLDGKNIYNLEIAVNMGAPSNLRVTIGTSTDPATHHEIMDLKDINESWMTPYKCDFSVKEEGDYYVGLYNYSTKESFYFNLFSLNVTAGMSSLVPEAPAKLAVVAGAAGTMKAELSCIVPSSLANGAPITDDINMVISRNGNNVHERKAAPGSEFRWTDESPAPGENTYTVMAKYGDADGITAEKTVWVGQDVPKNPSITAIRTFDRNMKVRIEWTEVKEGAHEGVYFNPSDVTYTVFRGRSSKEMLPIAEGLTGTSYEDKEPGSNIAAIQDSYFYAVAACNPAGKGSSEAEIIAVGKPYVVPEQESFPYGKLRLNPWLTDPIEGSFSWECTRDDADRGVSSQDHDNGLTRFYSYWGGETDSRLKSPVFDLSASKNPVLSLYMFHWEEESVAADNGMTRMIVEISRNGGEFEPLSDPITAGYHTYGWVEHRFLLSDYKDAETVQFGFRGQTDNDWMYFFIDNIRIDEQYTHDLAVEDFTGPATLTLGEKATFYVKYINRGLEPAENYTVTLYKDGQAVTSANGNKLQPGESVYMPFEVSLNAAHVYDENSFYAAIDYPKDEQTDNNRTSTLNTTTKGSFYPIVTTITGKNENGQAVLTWEAPQLPDMTPVVDGAEEYEPFAITDFGQWTTHDGDRLLSGYYTDLPEWEHRGENQAFMVWSPYELFGFDFDNYGSLTPYDGQQCFISWLANLYDDFFTPPVNNDYLISPEVTGGTSISFMVKGIDDISDSETYEIMYSPKSTSPDDFILIRQEKASGEWASIEAKLPDDARYFCIRYTGAEQMGLMVDNVSYVPVDASLKIQGYDVFRNGAKINDTPVKETTFTDNEMPQGNNTYRVAVVYDRGTSNASKGVSIANSGISTVTATSCTITTGHGVLNVSSPAPTALTVFGIDGVTVLKTTVCGDESFTLPTGIYIIQADGKTMKAVL